MKIHLATWLEDNQGKSLTKQNAKNRLMSYFFLKQMKGSATEFIKRYVTTGIGAKE